MTVEIGLNTLVDQIVRHESVGIILPDDGVTESVVGDIGGAGSGQ